MAALALIGWAVSRPALTRAAPAPEEPAFHATLKKIAAEYKSFGRLSDRPRMAPLCFLPRGNLPAGPPSPHVSASKDPATHGQKLYALFVKDQNSYLKMAKTRSAPIGQVLVKQAWIPKEVPRTGVGPESDQEEYLVWPYARKGGKVYRATKQADLFIMVKLDPKTPGTDDGWVYGTVSPDGKKVTSAGRVESCMRCHQETKHDRQFGLVK
jgi:hypothetical protein